MTNKTIGLAQRVVVIIACVLLSQSFNYGQTANPQTPPAVVKLRLSFEVANPRQLRFSPISNLLAAQREDGSVQIVDITDGREQVVLPLADKALYSMQWTKDGLRLFIITSKSAVLWDARTGARLSTPIEIKRDKYFMLFDQVALSADEKLLLSAKRDESIKATALHREKLTVQVWSLESGQLKFEIKVKGTYGRAELSPNDKQILTTADQGDPQLWDVETGRLFATLKPPERALFREGSDAQFSPDGRFVGQAHECGIYIWDSATGTIKTRIPYENASDSTFKGFTPDGKLVAIMRQSGGWHTRTFVELRDSETGELRSTLTDPKWDDWPDQKFWSDDGRTFITASGNKKYKARIWDAGTGRLKGTFPMVLTYSRIPFDFGFKDRDTLRINPTLPIISAASDKFIRLWSAETGELLQQFDGPGGHGEWSADGKLFLKVMKDLKIGASLGRGWATVAIESSVRTAVDSAPVFIDHAKSPDYGQVLDEIMIVDKLIDRTSVCGQAFQLGILDSFS